MLYYAFFFFFAILCSCILLLNPSCLSISAFLHNINIGVRWTGRDDVSQALCINIFFWTLM